MDVLNHLVRQRGEVETMLTTLARSEEGPEQLDSQVKSGAPVELPTKQDLYQEAQETGIAGRPGMSKAELAEALDK